MIITKSRIGIIGILNSNFGDIVKFFAFLYNVLIEPSSLLSLLLLYIKIFFIKISIIFSLLLIEFNAYINISKEYSPILAINFY